MSRYIDADVLKDDLINNRCFYPAIVESAIRNTPTADVVPAKRGSWIVTDADDGMCEDYAGFIEFKCSECGCGFGFENGQYDWYYGDPITWKACPMCGADMSAKMDGERKEENEG